MIRKIGLIGRTYRHIQRYREIIIVIAKHGFGDFISKTGIERYVGLGRRLSAEEKAAGPSPTRWERIRMVLEELGPTFVKFGQVMSNRPDLIPPPLISELIKLQDAVPPFPEKDALALVELELGKPIGELFSTFRSKPIASASIAQVHWAEMLNGETVAIKIQRPRIESMIEVDLEIMLHLASLLEKHVTGADLFNPVGLVEEFEKAIRQELDFEVEASHIERFGRNFQRDNTVYIPKVYREYSTKRVLTMEHIHGTKLADLFDKELPLFDRKLIAARGADLVLKQIFVHGFFHADPHPGNIMILENDVIGLLDFGMMGYLPLRHREQLSTLLLGVVNKDARRVTATLLRMSGNPHVENRNQLENDIGKMIEEYTSIPIRDIRLEDLLNRCAKLVMTYRLRIVPDFMLLIRALVTMDGIARKLDPGFDMVMHARPFAKRLLREQFSPRSVAGDLYSSLSDFGVLLKDLPLDVREIVEQFKQGRTKIVFEIKGLDPMLRSHEAISHRIVIALVTSALIIGSSLIAFSDLVPQWHGIPVLGLVGFIIAAVIGVYLLLTSLRKHRE